MRIAISGVCPKIGTAGCPKEGFLNRKVIPSGERLHFAMERSTIFNGKIMENHHFSWENLLFLWPCSIAFSMFTRGYRASMFHLDQRGPFDQHGSPGNRQGNHRILFCQSIFLPYLRSYLGVFQKWGYLQIILFLLIFH